MADLFSVFEQEPSNIPLAEKVRPQELDKIKGQETLLYSGSLLRSMIETGTLTSFILWGPPGSGKTTIARIIQKNNPEKYRSFSAVFSGIKEVKDVMKEAEYLLKLKNESTIIFIDEIHRFNKAQQDAFLPFIESGAIILIGATTENPSFEIISALLSRCQVFVLEKLKDESLREVLRNALEALDKVKLFSEESLEYLAQVSDGDARKALNNLENILKNNSKDVVSIDFIKQYLKKRAMYYDKNGEEHNNLISALHKSLRGSDPQAGLYWLARMLEAGEDPMYLVRRLVRFASEDIGLADPNALVQAIAVKEAVHFLGMPEASAALAQLVVYLGTAPKSNSADHAYQLASEEAKKTSHLGVPFNIRNAPTKLMKELNYGKDYKYSHDFQNHYSYQKCFPDAMKEKVYYTPSPFGFEKEIKKRLDWWEKLKTEQLKSE